MAQHQTSAFNGEWGWMSRKISAPPVQGEKCSLTSPFIEQALALRTASYVAKAICNRRRTDPNGPKSEAGNYVVVAEASGLNPVAQNVVVNVGLGTTADFDLTTVQQHKEQIVVSTSAPLVDDTRDVLGEVVDQRLVTDLPLNGRDFGKLVALVRPWNPRAWPLSKAGSASSPSTAAETAPTSARWNRQQRPVLQ